jgi:hypothetical protein
MSVKMHAEIPRSHLKTLSRLGWVFLIPALATSLPAQAVGPGMDIQCGGDGTVVITCHDSSNEWIVVSSSSLDGPWIPRLEPASPGSNTFQMTVPTPHQYEFFRLARGQRFVDDFEDNNLAGWSVFYPDPQFENFVILEPTNGQLRIHATCPACPNRRVYLYSTNVLLADFAMSFDILAYDERPGDHPSAALVARLEPRVLNIYSAHYLGGVNPAASELPGWSKVWLHRLPDNVGTVDYLPKMDPARDYRLVFYGVGNSLTVELYDLADLSVPIATNAVTDTGTPLPPGWIGFRVKEEGASGTVDWTLDNFVAVGTTP